jgi:bifunctional oxygenase/reductase
MQQTHVVVVGGGPVGLMLAGELRLGGAQVVVLERRAEPMTESRASTLHARTMEILDSRGLVERLGSPPVEHRGHFGGIPMDMTVPGRFSGQWKVPQTALEAMLQTWAVSLGAQIRRGHDVCEVDNRPNEVQILADGPEGPVTVRAQWVVACDGENSTVRRLVGADFPGQDATRELMRADVAGIEIADRRFQRLEHGLAIAARRPDGITRVMVGVFDAPARERTEPPPFAEVRDAWLAVTGEDIGHGTPTWLNAFDDTSRQLSAYRHGRVLFAGDAAHRQMPIGGQALNLGLQDAVNLGWKLALQVSKGLPTASLDSYHDERHPVGRRVLANIRAQAMLQLGGPEVEPVRQVVAELIGYKQPRGHLAAMIAGTDVRYEAGANVHPLHGMRFPVVPVTTGGGPATSSSLLRDGRALLLDLTGDDVRHQRFRQRCEPWADRLTTLAARPVAHSLPAAGTAFLVRPDGHVGWVGAEPDDALETAIQRWFGSPGRARSNPPTMPTQEDTMKLIGKSALVTGASRGMGRATARRLAADGALVAVHYATGHEAAKSVVADVEKDGGRAFAVQADLSTPGAVHELFLSLERGLKERTGTTDLHILVNNAGVMTGGGSPEDTTEEMFDRVFAVNTKAPFFIIQRALQNMPDGGRIINISSGLTRFANPDEVAYAMSKGAVEQLALHFAKYLGPRRITVNSVAPGITRNDNPVFGIPEAVEQMSRLSAFGRIGEPEDVADVTAFLASDAARWVTGAFIDASGGTLLG